MQKATGLTGTKIRKGVHKQFKNHEFIQAMKATYLIHEVHSITLGVISIDRGECQQCDQIILRILLEYG